jgi:hypothetical protein
MADSLLDDCRGCDDWLMLYLAALAFFLCMYDLHAGFVDGQRVGVDGGLGHEAVGHGKTQYTCDESGAAEEEEIPVETGGFFEGKLSGLGCETAYILGGC